MSIIKFIKGWLKKNETSQTPYNLQRFVTAQEKDYNTALSEIINGRKMSHWIWYIFPQVYGLGHSAYANMYGIQSIAEAEAYLAHPILGKRLREITNTLLSHRGKSADKILGGIDAMKVKSSMTHFDLVSPNDIFQEVLDTFYDGNKDILTMKILHIDENVQKNKTEQPTADEAVQYDYTPELITSLRPNEVFVFGSNLAGRHAGGAARAAVENFGAIWGQGVGLQGQSYAIPTMQGGVETIKPYVDEFIAFANKHTDLIFLVTPIGCGIAGFRDEEISPLFREALAVPNIVLPKSFVSTLGFAKNPMLLGAICGDVIGSVYEFHTTKDYNFTLFRPSMFFTDDSVMTVAVADWVMNSPMLSYDELVDTMRYFGERYPGAGYGGNFGYWLRCDNPKPYDSWGNGSAMRVSACGFAFNTEEEVLHAAELSAAVTHNHPEGIKGAQATAMAVFLARNGSSKDEIKQYVEQKFGYDLSRAYKDIQPLYQFEISCQETVPQSIICFLESENYEDCIRKAIAMGGDADTMGAIAGAIAAAYYKEIPSEIVDFVMARLTEDLSSVVKKFSERYS